MAGLMEGKVAVVTGAGGGVGREIAIMMAKAGASVIIADIGASLSGEGGSASPAEQTKALINQQGGLAEICTESVAAWGSARKIIQAALDHYGRIDAVVNNAGILRDGIFHRMSEDDWLSVISRASEWQFLRLPRRRRAFSGAGKRHVRAHHLDVRPDRQHRSGQLRRRQTWDHRTVEIDRARHGPLQRPVQLSLTMGLEPDDQFDPDQYAGTGGGGRETETNDAGQERAAGGIFIAPMRRRA